MELNNYNTVKVNIKRLHSEDLPLPAYMTAGASGLDLYAAIASPVLIRSGERILVPTGIAIAVPSGWEAQIRPRSGLAIKHGLTLLNSPGTIDSDYRGEIKIIVINCGQQEYTLFKGERIAQMVFSPVVRAKLCEVTGALEETDRGTGGFGHTGK
ncbi:MAG: dUTP diphosphatase [Syntrophomonadaceae bacterium]|jgi:dUTP pyrophosphatase|nr:dUTP diphosphatase [Syntrophomonadaceae bacterium]